MPTRDIVHKIRARKDRLLVLVPLVMALVAYHSLPSVYFVSDDFIDMMNIANRGPLYFYLSPFAGHMIFTRNIEVILMYALFGPAHPEAYGALTLLTHLINVALLFRVARAFTGSAVLAALGAAAWGACPLLSEALGWHSVWGQVFCTTMLLLVLDGIAKRQARQTPISVKDVLRWSLFLLLGATCFGGGISVALSFPLLVGILLDAPLCPRRALLSTLGLPVVVLVLYFGWQWLYKQFWPVPLDVQMMQHLATSAYGPPAKMTGYLLAIGSTGLIRGFHLPETGYPNVSWSLFALTVMGVLGTLVFGDNNERRRVVVLAMIAVSIYAMIALGRANAYKMFGISPFEAAQQLRYHYNSTVPVALLITVVLRRLARMPDLEHLPSLPAIALGGWVIADAHAYSTSRWEVNTHQDCREYVANTLREIDQKVDQAPAGQDVRIPNQELPHFCTGIFGPDAIPGWAVLYLIFHPNDDLHGRLVHFTEEFPHERSGRLAKLLVVTSPEAKK